MSSSATESTSSLASGPQTPSVHSEDVWSTNWTEPRLVGPAHAAAGDHAVAVLVDPDDRQVGNEPAVLGEDRGVHRLADVDVHAADGHLLGVLRGTWADQVEDGKAHVADHPHVVAHVEVLGEDDR
jgi:hypothetical protein